MKKLDFEFLGRICYGFTEDKASQVRINERQKQVVSTIYEKYQDGYSLMRLAEWVR